MEQRHEAQMNRRQIGQDMLGYLVAALIIAAAAGLRVWPNAQVGQGATFYFTLGGAS
jgi:hypothetical protein